MRALFKRPTLLTAMNWDIINSLTLAFLKSLVLNEIALSFSVDMNSNKPGILWHVGKQ